MEGVIRSEMTMDAATGVLTHKQSQPSENIILARNAELRKNPGAIQDLGSQSKGEGGSWGRQIASIPEIMYNRAIRIGFELNHKDQDHAAAEMRRFLATSEGKKCLIRGKEKRIFTGIGEM